MPPPYRRYGARCHDDATLCRRAYAAAAFAPPPLSRHAAMLPLAAIRAAAAAIDGIFRCRFSGRRLSLIFATRRYATLLPCHLFMPRFRLPPLRLPMLATH